MDPKCGEMAAHIELPLPSIENEVEDAARCCLQSFKLYETRSNFYMIGRDKNRTLWRVLKINRLEPSELDFCEDATTYSDSECDDLLRRIHEGNRPTGGLRFVTHCYGIVGFVKFLGPYYMLLITKRRQIGTICGHRIYSITKSRMIAVASSIMQSDITDSKNENRYKKLLCTVDLTKDFFFSYSYHVMRSLQKNLSDSQTGHVVYETMFVWNEFLTRTIRNHLNNTIWTVALVYGFFKQEKLSLSGKQFRLTLIARRSRHYAGTRYFKRGVNKKGSVANDVETEQIVFEDSYGGYPSQVTSVVQYRGSIPLHWSQETSRLYLKPDIVLDKKDRNYQATRLHFEDLSERYGNPIIILNLIKTQESRPRESKLRAEFANAIHFINKDSPEENHLRFLHWDLNRRPRRKATDVLELLGKVAAYSLNLTGFFYCQLVPSLKSDGICSSPILSKDSSDNQKNSSQVNKPHWGKGSPEDNEVHDVNCFTILPKVQKGVLRTNCIDCLDRTNVAQYTYGLAALGHQLHALGLIDAPKIDLDTTLADELMSFYEIMGDTLAEQYTGSAAHNKIFSERRGHWKAAIQSQEFLRTLQRYYSNAYIDAQKQDAIDVFLGYFQPENGKPALWELDYDGRETRIIEYSRSFIRRSLSDGNILHESSVPSSDNLSRKKLISSALPDIIPLKGESKVSYESSPEISSCDNTMSYSRYLPTLAGRHLFTDNDQIYFNGSGLLGSDFSNFLDIDQLSSSGNSCDEETYDRSPLIKSLVASLSTENIMNGEEITSFFSTTDSTGEVISSKESEIQDHPSDSEFSKHFSQWVTHGETLCH